MLVKSAATVTKERVLNECTRLLHLGLLADGIYRLKIVSDPVIASINTELHVETRCIVLSWKSQMVI